MRQPFEVEEVEERRAVPWKLALRSFLEWYEEYREKILKMARGREGSDEYESFEVPAENSFQPGYAETHYAQLKALARETVGGERPTGEETEGRFEDPAIAFITRTASAVPEFDFLPPVDHDRAIADTWSGNDGVYKALYDAFDRLDLDREDWVYHRQGEPHAGDGKNACYGHDHTLIIFDAAATDSSLGEVEAELEPVIDRHVDRCEYAGERAHDYERTLTVETVGAEGIADVAAYMAEYVSVYPEDGDDEVLDLLERDIEYLAWAATQWATGTQKYTRSKGANAAISADACKQRCESEEYDQEAAHGEEVVAASKKAHHDFECRKCGSPWGIDQSPGTLTEARLTDGGEIEGGGDGSEAADPGDGDGESDLRGRWPSARSAAVVGEPTDRAESRERIETYLDNHPDADSVEVAAQLFVEPELVEEVRDGGPGPPSEGFERAPSWRLEVIRDGGGEEHQPSSGGVDTRPLILPEASNPRWEEVRDQPGTAYRAPDGFVTYNAEVFKSHVRRKWGAGGPGWIDRRLEAV